MIAGLLSLFRHSHPTLHTMMGQTTVKFTLNILISTLKILYWALCFSSNFSPCLKHLKSPRFGKQFNSTLTTRWRYIQRQTQTNATTALYFPPRFKVVCQRLTVAKGTISRVVLLQWPLKCSARLQQQALPNLQHFNFQWYRELINKTILSILAPLISTFGA